MRKTLQEFASVLPQWYNDFKTSNKYYKGYIELLGRLPGKAKRLGHLEIEDLSAIADWGGNTNGVKQRMRSSNTPDEVQKRTAEASLHFDKPSQAIGAILELNQWGLSYGSKTLMFMNTDEFAILDSWIRKCLREVLPSTRDGDRNSTIKGYSKFIEHCRDLQRLVAVPGPGPNAEWRIADIQQALFQYAQTGGVIVP